MGPQKVSPWAGCPPHTWSHCGGSTSGWPPAAAHPPGSVRWSPTGAGCFCRWPPSGKTEAVLDYIGFNPSIPPSIHPSIRHSSINVSCSYSYHPPKSLIHPSSTTYHSSFTYKPSIYSAVFLWLQFIVHNKEKQNSSVHLETSHLHCAMLLFIPQTRGQRAKARSVLQCFFNWGEHNRAGS